MAAVRRTIRRNLVIDARLAVLDVPRLARRHLAGPNSLRNALLLVLCPHARPRERRILRMPAIHRSKVAAIGMRHLHMILLFRGGLNMSLVRKRSLSLTSTRLDAARAAVEARAVIHRVVD